MKSLYFYILHINVGTFAITKSLIGNFLEVKIFCLNETFYLFNKFIFACFYRVPMIVSLTVVLIFFSFSLRVLSGVGLGDGAADAAQQHD